MPLVRDVDLNTTNDIQSLRVKFVPIFQNHLIGIREALIPVSMRCFRLLPIALEDTFFYAQITSFEHP
jgi:hypothetical protein